MVLRGKSKLVYCCEVNPVLISIIRQKYMIAKFLIMQGGDINWRGPNTPSAVQIAVD